MPAVPRDDRTDSPALLQHYRATHRAGAREAESDDPFARYLWTRLAMGDVTPARKRQLLREAEQRRARYPYLQPRSAGGMMAASSQAPIPVWIPVGPAAADYEQNSYPTIHTTVSGRLRKILVHPTDPNTVYVLASGGGLWRTSNFLDASPAWTVLTDGVATTSGGSVAFGRTPSVLYLGLGDPFDVLLPGGAMVKSTDGGNTWSNSIDLGNAVSVLDVAVDTSASQDIVLVGTDVGLFRSADGGATYTQIAGGAGEALNNQEVWSIVKTSAGWLLSAESLSNTGGALYLSADKGLTWSPITNSNGAFSGAGRTTLAVGVPGDSVVYAFAASCNDPRYSLPNCDTDQWDLFRSSDGGQNWTALGLRNKTPVNSIPNSNDQTDMDVMHDQAWYNQMLGVDPADPNRNTVYIGGNLTSDKSTDGGNTWTILTDWLNGYYGLPYVHADLHTISFASTPNGPMVLYGGDGGLFTSTDAGLSWDASRNTGLQTFLIYSLASSPSFPEAVIIGTQDNGTRVRSGDTALFNAPLGGDGLGVGWSQANTNAGISSYPFVSLVRNLSSGIPDLGETWEDANSGIDASTAGFYTPVATPTAAADPSGLVFFTATTTNLYKTVDGALSWSVFGGVTGDFRYRSLPHIIGISPIDLNHVAAGGTTGRVTFTTDGGASYTTRSINTLVPGFQSDMSSVTWANNATLYVASVVQASGAVRVAKGTGIGTGNDTWNRADTGLPDLPVYKIVLDPSDASGNTLLAATYNGVYRTTDGGSSWQLYGAGLPNVRVSDIYLPPDGSFIRIATYGRGVWELPQLFLQNATLTDDATSCAVNGVLENGETGSLSFTLKNSSGIDLTAITGTVTTMNPNVSFPGGNTVSLPTASAGGIATGSVAVALSGASGPQQIDFTIAFNDPALGLSAPVKVVTSFRANVRQSNATSDSDDFESSPSAWTVSGTENIPDVLDWKIGQFGPLQHRWVGVGSNRASDQKLISPVLNVGQSPLSFSFQHRYAFYYSGASHYDGGVIEISKDNGATWTDIGASATPGYDAAISDGSSPIAGRAAYDARSAGYPAMVPVTVSLGTAYAGQNVRVRFRLVTTDYNLSPGWEIDDLAFQGISNTPFNALLASPGCTPPSLQVTATADAATVAAGSQIGFTLAVSNSAAANTESATAVGLTAPLPGSVDWSISPAYSGPGSCAITGTIGGESLTCSLGTLASATSATVHVIGTSPSTSATYSTTATASSGNATTTTANASIVARVPPSLSPDPVSFGSLLIYSGRTATAVLTNHDAAVLAVSSISVDGGFSQANDCPASLAPGASCNVTVNIEPATLGTYTGNLRVAFDAPGGPLQIPVSATAVDLLISINRPNRTARTFANTVLPSQTAPATVTAAPLTLHTAFTPAIITGVRPALKKISDSGQAWTFQFTNPGPVSLAIRLIELPIGLRADSDCGAEVEAHAVCQIKVSRPVEGWRPSSATLSVVTDSVLVTTDLFDKDRRRE